MSAYGLGELPGKSIAEAADVIFGETGDHLHIPQLSARGLGADAIGRTIGLFDAINVDRGARSWVMSARPSRLSHRTRDFLDSDLDTCEEVWGTTLDRIKIQVTGPWTLGARIELANGHLVLTDQGAMRDLTEALVHSICTHAADVSRRFRATVDVQIDEPDLFSVANGLLQGTSSFDTIRAVNAAVLSERLSTVFRSIKARELPDSDAHTHCYLNLTGQVPNWEVVREASADTVQLTMDKVQGNELLDGFGEAISSGVRIGLGVTRSSDIVDELRARPRKQAVDIARFFDALGLNRSHLIQDVDVHPRMGLNDGTVADAANAYRMAKAVAQMLEQDSGDL